MDFPSTLTFQEDRMLEGVARQVATDLNTFFSKERLEHAAMEHERLRLARELHDGVLQSLTGVTLQLRQLSRLVEDYPEPVRNRLREVEELMVAEQRELRGWIDALKPPTSADMASKRDMATALGTLCNRVSRWGMRVELIMSEEGTIARTLGDEIYRIVQEALSNAARHARAHAVRIELDLMSDRVGLTIEDDGCGFPFQGQFDLAVLNTRNWGPVSIKERVASLRGDLVLTSTLSGSRIEITLPRQRTLSNPEAKRRLG
jgi:signal transduction histidine kinase